MQLRPFEIERYYARYAFSTRFMLSSSDCESRTVADVLALEAGSHDRLLDQWCGYTESPGSSELREAIASIYETISPEDVVVMTCAEEAIFVLYHALLGTNDHAIVETPCYQSAIEVARSTGAQVSEWERRFVANWPFDLDALAGLIRPNTRVLYLNQPHNPTGTLMPQETFEHVVALAQERGLTLFCDEVYRELEHDPAIRL